MQKEQYKACKANNNGNKIESRGSGNFSSDEAKEIARLRKELKDT